MPRVNTDEILREFGDWRNTADLMKAGKIAVKRLNSYLLEGITFNQETTLCGHSILRTIDRAKQLGYVIEKNKKRRLSDGSGLLFFALSYPA